MKILVPKKVKRIIDTLQSAGFEAYVVGGCVRDSILGREPQDWDITSSAKPEEVKALFPHTVDTGLQHGTVTIIQDKEGFEVTTYRIDGAYEDGRHPKEVIFTPNLEEDLKRRDFTINAMAYNDANGLVDLYGGMEDIKAGIIRCVGNPKERFGEDALRMLRALRFSAQLGYSIEKKTRDGIRELADTLRNISAERIQTELIKMMVSDKPDTLREAHYLGVTKVFFPEFDRAMETVQNHPHHMYSVGEHILHSLSYVQADKVLRLAMLFHDIGKTDTMTMDHQGVTHFKGHASVSAEMCKEILRRLKFDCDTISQVSRLVMYHDYDMGVKPDSKIVRRAMNTIGEDIFAKYLEVRYADIQAQSSYQRQEKLDNLQEWVELYHEIVEKGQCVSLKKLAVTGSDLIAAGMKPGKEMGVVLNRLLAMVLDNPALNTKEALLEEFMKMNLV